MFSSEAWLANSVIADFYNGVATQSLRFQPNNLLSETLGTSTNQQKQTISIWFKRTEIATEQGILASNQNTATYFRFESSGAIRFRSTSVIDLKTNRLFRDTSAWYHLQIIMDFTSAESQYNKVKIYINGVRETSFATNTLPSNNSTNSPFNVNGAVVYIGSSYSGGAAGYFNGYISEVNVVDGLALGTDSFAEAKNGIWIAKTPSVTYGDNGYRLQFEETGTGTGASDTVGADTSGGTAHHFDSSIIVASDCAMLDSPENNFATLLGGGIAESSDYQAYSGSGTYAEGNLKLTGTSAWSNGKANFEVNSGKWYAEYVVTALHATTHNRFGVYVRPARTYDEYFWMANGTGQLDAGNKNAKVGTYAVGNVLQVALDLDNNNVFFGKNNTWENSATESEIEAGTATNAFASGSEVPTGDGHNYGFYNNPHSSSAGVWNFGQEQTFAGYMDSSTTAKTPSNSGAGTADSKGNGRFFYEPPTGFLALCSANLPEPTIGPNSDTQATDHFNTVIYTANNNQAKTVTGLGLRPDWLWIKGRNFDDHHAVFDSNRGENKFISAARNSAQFTDATLVTSFDANDDGFVLGTDGYGWVNFQSTTVVAWGWKANAGTATATISESGDNPAAVVQANPTAGFSIITYTGTGANGTIAHGLSAVPQMMIFKNLATTQDWAIYHSGNTAAPATDHLHLNTTDETVDDATFFNDTAPTSSVITIGTHANVNVDGAAHVAYVFAEVEGYSKFGSYQGNADNDGAFVYTGFEVAFVMARSTDGSSWYMFDNKRTGFNGANFNLFANGSAAEGSANFIDFLSNGFKFIGRGNSDPNKNEPHIYMAFGKTFKYANAK